MDLNQHREDFLKLLTNAQNLDDPLALHQQYIEGLKALPTTDQTAKFLLEGLERATQAFIEDRRYGNDPRYLRIWLDYASRCREPEDVFAFLAMKGVCLDLAAYYEEYSGYLERRKLEMPGTVEKILKIFQSGIERKAQPLERLRKYYSDFLQKHSLADSSMAVQANSMLSSEPSKRHSWSVPPPNLTATTCWTSSNKANSTGRRRPVEVRGYCAAMLDNDQYCFEEIRAKEYLSKAPAVTNLTVIDCGADDDELDDVPSLAVAVNPDDLTHISVYRDNTADLKELAKLAQKNNELQQQQQQQQQQQSLITEKENLSAMMDGDVVMKYVGEEEDPFERIQSMEMTDGFGGNNFSFERKRKERLSLIPEEAEVTMTSLKSHLKATLINSEVRLQMESSLNPGIIHNFLIVHESALAKVRQLEKTIGRDGTGGNQTVSALRTANGHFFIERRLAPSKVFLAVDLESDITIGKCNQWAMKIVSPPTKWEQYILSRLPGDCPFFPKINSCCHYNDVVFTTMTFYESGSLQKLLESGVKFEELLVLYYTSQLLKILAILVQVGIVHCRISTDHLQLRFTDHDGTWLSKYAADGANGWASKGIALTGFSKSVDLTLLKSSSFIIDQAANSSAGHEIDMRAISQVISSLLAKDDSSGSSNSHQSMQFAFIWQKVFTFLGSTWNPLTTANNLAVLIGEVDATLEVASVQCSPSLKGLLTKLEISLLK